MTKRSTTDSFMVADWYNTRYVAGQEQSFGRPPEESVLRLNKLPIRSSAKVLNVACRQSYFLKAAHEHGHQTYGVDIAYEAIRISRQISPQSETLIASGQTLPFPDHYFDVVTCWGSLEHHPDMECALSEFTRVVKSSDIIFLRVPNRAFWLYRLASRFGAPLRLTETSKSDEMQSAIVIELGCDILIGKPSVIGIRKVVLKMNFLSTAAGFCYHPVISYYPNNLFASEEQSLL